MRPEKMADKQFEDQRLTKVEDYPDGWAITGDCGTLSIPKYAATPRVGDVARFYGKGLGYPVRGVDVAGIEVYYRTEAEYEEHFRREQADRDAKRKGEYVAARESLTARINALPGAFQKRLFKFRERDMDYGWKFEGYEVTCAETAHKIATTCERRDDGSTVEDWLKRFHALPWDEQNRMVAGLDDGLSGNMFGFAVRHAMFYLTQPELIAKDHGALCVLVGCDGFKSCDAFVSKSAKTTTVAQWASGVLRWAGHLVLGQPSPNDVPAV